MIEFEPALVSVLMTVYNRENYLAEAIESVLASSYKNLELIIVDDCSLDKSYEIAKSYADIDERVLLFQNEKNLGDYFNRNKAATYASGKYIKFVDSDDAIFNWGLAYCVEQMELFPEAALGTLSFEGNVAERMVSSSAVIEEHFFQKELLNIGPSGTIFKKEIFENIGFFDTSFGIASDVYVNIKLASLHPVVLLPKVFFFYRKHEGQQQFNSRFAYLFNNYQYKLRLLAENILPLTNSQQQTLKTRIRKNMAINLLRILPYPYTWRKVLRFAKEANFNWKDFRQLISG